jgi:sRNA-binding protein
MTVQVNFKSSFYAFEREEKNKEERIKQEREAQARQERETKEKQDKETREKYEKAERERKQREAQESAAREEKEKKERINREMKSIDDDVSAIVSKIRQLSQQQRDLKISSGQDKNVARILINELGGCKGDLERKETALDNLTGLDDTQKSTRLLSTST